MNAKELNRHFVRTFGFNRWPNTFEVDAETYGLICQDVFDHELTRQFPAVDVEFKLKIAMGPHNGIMFRDVELLLKGRGDEKV